MHYGCQYPELVPVQNGSHLLHCLDLREKKKVVSSPKSEGLAFLPFHKRSLKPKVEGSDASTLEGSSDRVSKAQGNCASPGHRLWTGGSNTLIKPQAGHTFTVVVALQLSCDYTESAALSLSPPQGSSVSHYNYLKPKHKFWVIHTYRTKQPSTSKTSATYSETTLMSKSTISLEHNLFHSLTSSLVPSIDTAVLSPGMGAHTCSLSTQEGEERKACL